MWCLGYGHIFARSPIEVFSADLHKWRAFSRSCDVPTKSPFLFYFTHVTARELLNGLLLNSRRYLWSRFSLAEIGQKWRTLYVHISAVIAVATCRMFIGVKNVSNRCCRQGCCWHIVCAVHFPYILWFTRWFSETYNYIYKLISETV
jgi:hypothetical protein